MNYNRDTYDADMASLEEQIALLRYAKDADDWRREAMRLYDDLWVEMQECWPEVDRWNELQFNTIFTLAEEATNKPDIKELEFKYNEYAEAVLEWLKGRE
jgi:hypothetical protein